eukprot:5727116-Prorocentrum_lima.AAC.1
MTAYQTHIVRTCINYGCQSYVELVTRAMRDIMPTSDLSRMRMAQELHMSANKLPGTLVP